MHSLETTSGHSETTSHFVTLHSETNAGELPEVTATAGCCDCWKPQRVAGDARKYDGKCSFYYNCYFYTQLQQTETSDKNLSIFLSGKKMVICLLILNWPNF